MKLSLSILTLLASAVTLAAPAHAQNYHRNTQFVPPPGPHPQRRYYPY
jgi:hypothetical protein